MSQKIAIVGNPNSGKSSLFNNLTGLNQKVGNYPGVTVDRKSGNAKLSKSTATIIDLPGTYSVYPKTEDESVAMSVLMDRENPDFPDKVIVVVDATHLNRNMLFFTQIHDLGFPCIIALTMVDIAKKQGVTIDLNELQIQVGVPIVVTNPRLNKGTTKIKQIIESYDEYIPAPNPDNKYYRLGDDMKKAAGFQTSFSALVYACNHSPEFDFLAEAENKKIEEKIKAAEFRKHKFQAEDTYRRYGVVKQLLKSAVFQTTKEEQELRDEKIDEVLLHKVWGNLILLLILFLVFQTIYKVAEWPAALVEGLFQTSAGWMHSILPAGWLTDLWIEGIWAGLSGIAIFIPQIILLFSLINLLEDSGYMARISFLTDRGLRRVGLSGRSAMPLISSFACAVPAIMATRTIPSKKERLLAIMTIPLLSCSARLPVYIILIGLLIPAQTYLGFISLQGLVLLAVYLFAVFFTMTTSWVMSKLIKVGQKSHFFLELPNYRSPRIRNVIYSAYQKTRIFVMDAGKIIMVISVILWFLASYGPSAKMDAIDHKYELMASKDMAMKDSIDHLKSAEKLESSYAGILGHTIEPVIKPLGFDWKIGIALITSFAAREVFVSTMSTIYSIGDDGSETRLIQKLDNAKDEHGQKVFTLGTGLALLVFYILAMQCMSTLAIVKRETNSWKWPMIQLVYMSVLAYIMAYITQWVF